MCVVAISVILISMDPSYSPGAPEPQNVHELLNLYDQKSSRSVAPKKSFLLLVAGAVVLILIIFFLFLRSRG